MKRRSTPSKQAVLDVLSRSKKAMSHETIQDKIDMDINRATIYRILNQFCEDGLVHSIVAEDGKQYFAICMDFEGKTLPDSHFHFRCTSCQTITCLEEKVDFSLPQGFNVESVNCVLTGTCIDCR